MARGRKRTPLYDPSVIPYGHPSMLDIAWLSGFYEGEGHCSIHANQFTLQICQKNLEPLTKIKHLFGGVIYTNPNHPQSGTVYFWKVNYERAEGIAFTIFSFLSIEKREQIVKAMKAYRILSLMKELDFKF